MNMECMETISILVSPSVIWACSPSGCPNLTISLPYRKRYKRKSISTKMNFITVLISAGLLKIKYEDLNGNKK